jgi:FlaA1/EpsC-like NDP-sugar epimerase
MTGVEGRSILVLGGGGMVGTAVCRELLARKPARIAIAARREAKARQGARRAAHAVRSWQTERSAAGQSQTPSIRSTTISSVRRFCSG